MDIAKLVLGVFFILFCIALVLLFAFASKFINIKVNYVFTTNVSEAIQFQNFRAFATAFHKNLNYIDFILLKKKFEIPKIICEYYFANGKFIYNNTITNTLNITVILPDKKFVNVSFYIKPCLVISS